MKNDNLLIKLREVACVDDHDIAKSINQMSCHLVSYLLRHFRRCLNKVMREGDSFYSNSSYYGDTDGAYMHKNIGLRWLRRVTLVNTLDLIKTTLVMPEYSTLGT